MVKYVIHGGKQLNGEITVSGAKNAVSAIIPATVLCEGVCRIENVPKISDVTTMLDILSEIGAKIRVIDDTTLEIDASHVRNMSIPYEPARRMRASYYFAGVMLGRFNNAHVAMPGGCDLGVRPIDQHIKGFEALGAAVELRNGYICANSEKPLEGTQIYLDMASVGATINIMLASVLADGMTVIENAAKEPHVVDLANFLNTIGADIKGAGTDIIKIRGRKSLHGGTYAIIPDQIVAGTYMAAVAATGGNVLIKNVIPKHIDCISAKFTEMGVSIEEFDDSVRVISTGKLRRSNVKTLPYPGFPTDMQPQVTVCLSVAPGTSMVTESISDNRYRFVDELKRMGARITVDSKIAVVEGVRALSGARVRACDLRAGAALLIAGLAAQGITEIEGVHYIERGYEDVVEDLRALGADIVRVEEPDADTLQIAL